MKSGISRRQFAQRDGCDEKLVRRGIQQGNLIAFDDGTIDPELVGTPWRKSNRKARTTADSPQQVPATGLESFADAQRRKENYLAKLRQLEFEVKSGRVVDADAVRGRVFALARADRDALQNWPSRISAIMASELGVDAAVLVLALERHLRDFLEERSDEALRSRADRLNFGQAKKGN